MNFLRQEMEHCSLGPSGLDGKNRIAEPKIFMKSKEKPMLNHSA